MSTNTRLQNDIGAHRKSSTDASIFVELLADEHAQAAIVIETEHAQTHAGRVFNFSAVNISIGAGLVKYVLVKPNEELHLRGFELNSTISELEISFFESPTGTDDGTLQPAALNRNRISTKVSPTQIYYDPIVTDDGTRLRQTAIHGTKKESGDIGGIAAEWILNPSRVYLIKITNNNVSTAEVHIEMFWYHPEL